MKQKKHTWPEMMKVATKNRVQKFVASWCEVAYRGMELTVVGQPETITFHLFALPYRKPGKRYGIAHFKEGDLNKEWRLRNIEPVSKIEKQRIVNAFFGVRKRNAICRPVMGYSPIMDPYRVCVGY